MNDNEKDRIPPESDSSEPVESNAMKIIRAREGEASLEREHHDEPLAKGKWWENFWYHYKWHTIFVLVFGTFIIIAVTQFVAREKPDIYVMYAGPEYVNSDDNGAVRSAFKQVMSEDFNNDGIKGVMLTDITYLNGAQIEERLRQAEEEGIEIAMDYQANVTALNRFNMEIFAGESVICMLDPELYRTVLAAGGFLTLEEILGYVPDNALDAYGLRLHDTEFAQYFQGIRELPEDTVLCMRRLSTTSVFKGQKKMERIHSNHMIMFRDIVEFRFPEGYHSDTAESTGE